MGIGDDFTNDDDGKQCLRRSNGHIWNDTIHGHTTWLTIGKRTATKKKSSTEFEKKDGVSENVLAEKIEHWARRDFLPPILVICFHFLW